jgi:hypothetical protein
MLSWTQIQRNAERFSQEWDGETYERGESQTFYNQFFEVFGVPRRRVARFEEHVRLMDRRLGRVASGFIDLLWPGVLIVEQKSAGRDLSRAEARAGEYFDALPDADKPRYRLVCDFRTFRLVDMDTDSRVEFALKDLPANVQYFAFMLGKQASKHRVPEALNVMAAEHIAHIYKDLRASGYDQNSVERFLTRIVFCLFADNTGIFQPRGQFFDLVESRTASDGSDLGQWLVHLFQVLDTPPSRRKRLDDDLACFPFINGGLFNSAVPIPTLSASAREKLLAACRFDWSQVSPAIFGALFQSVLGNKERREIGAYSTTEQNILKVLDDVCLRQLRAECNDLLQRGASRAKSLRSFQRKLSQLQFFDPACGCGNFLVIAYREVRRLELRVLKDLFRLGQLEKADDRVSIIDVDVLFGIESRAYSARIAETAIWMTDHIANNELSIALGVDFHRMPLAKAPTIYVGNALSYDWQSLCCPSARVHIIGNPPYKGPKQQDPSERVLVTSLASDTGSLDLVCGWIVKAAAYAKAGARVGLVTVSSVCQGEQAGRLWPLLFDDYGLEIAFAHQPFKWSSDSPGDANVQVVVLGLVGESEARDERLLHEYDYRGDSEKSNQRICSAISPYLIDGSRLRNPELVVRETSRPANGFRRLRTGTKPIDGGYYILTPEERRDLVAAEPSAEKFVRPFVGGDEFLYGKERYILLLKGVPARELKSMRHIRTIVEKVSQYRHARIASKDGSRRLKQPSERRLLDDPTRLHIEAFPERPFLVIPEVTSELRHYIPIGFLDPPAVPSNLVKFLGDAELWEFAILTSAMHMAWVRTIGGRLEGRLRYSIGVVYNTFPLPGGIDHRALGRLATGVLEARAVARRNGLSLADMYDPLKMPPDLLMAHRAVDAAVDTLYLGRRASTEEQRVVELLSRYGA